MKAELHTTKDFVQANLARSSKQYDRHTILCSLRVGDPIWLSIPTAWKLQPHWDGKWTVGKLKGPCNLELTNGNQSKPIYVNHV